jgi:hypothetical protein
MCRACRECGRPFTATNQGRGSAPIFCSKPCKKTFANRRMLRGAQLYDMFMLLRYERGVAQLRGIWALTCELARQWRAEDVSERGGRQSWRAYDELHAGLAPLRVVAMQSAGAAAGRIAVENSIAARSRAA